MTSDEFLLACLSIGISVSDLRYFTIGTLLNLINTKVELTNKAEKKAKAKASGKDTRKATQADIDALAM